MYTTINPIYSPESISFQNNSFHKELTAIIDEHRNKNSIQDHNDFEIALNKCIKERTNISFDIHVGDYMMSTEPPNIDKNSPLMEGYGWKNMSLSKQSLADIRASKDKELKAYLDPNTSFVNGYFSKLDPIRMYFNGSMFYGNKSLSYKLTDGREYTSGELAAIVLHEVGHIWAFFDFMVRFRTTNQVLATMVRQLDGTEDFGQREIIIRETNDLLQLQNVDSEDLSRKNNTTIYTVIVSNIARLNKSQSGNPGYDINSFEALADQFAARHGASRDLVTALDKLHQGSIYRRGWVGYMFMELLKLIFGGLGIYAAFTGAIGTGAYLFLVTLSLIFVDSHHDWYDKTGYRFKRIRNDLVQELKDPNTSKEDSARIRQDIEMIDDVNEKYKDHTQLVGLIYDYLIPSGVNKRKDIEFQQRLEEMSANKLFVYANQFKHA